MEFFINPKLRWILFFMVFVLNFIAFYQDPPRFTSNQKCYFNSSCRWFSYLAGLTTFSLDIITFMGLWFTIGPKIDWLPTYWFAPLIVIGYAIITQITIDTPNYSDADEEAPKTPPMSLWPQKWRIILYTTILLLDAIIFIQFYIDNGIHKYSLGKYSVSDYIFKSRFGGYAPKNEVQFIFSWLGILGVFIDILALYFVVTFQGCQYGLPNTWNF